MHYAIIVILHFFKSMKKLLFSLLLLVFFSKILAQNVSVRYYNMFGNIVSSADLATFFSEYHISDTGVLHNQFLISNNKIFLSEQLTDMGSKTKNGQSVIFYPNGQIRYTGNYVNNKKQGPWMSFYPNGYLKDSTSYNNGLVTDVLMRWHANGAYADSINYDKRKLFKGSWFDNGNPNSFGYCRGNEDTLIGKWTFFHRNGQVAAHEEYDTLGKLLSAKYFDENGNVVEKIAEVSREKQTEKALKALDKYLEKHFSFPTGRIKQDMLISLAIEFTIDEAGKMDNVFVLVSSRDEFNEAFVKALKSFDKWPSFTHKNRKVQQKFVLSRLYYYSVTGNIKRADQFNTNNGLYESRFDPKIESNRRFIQSMWGQGINDKW